MGPYGTLKGTNLNYRTLNVRDCGQLNLCLSFRDEGQSGIPVPRFKGLEFRVYGLGLRV